MRPPSATLTNTLFPYTNALPSLDRPDPGRRMAAVGLGQRPAAHQDGHARRVDARRVRRLEPGLPDVHGGHPQRSEEHTSELQSLMRISYAVFCLKQKNNTHTLHTLIYIPNIS